MRHDGPGRNGTFTWAEVLRRAAEEPQEEPDGGFFVGVFWALVAVAALFALAFGIAVAL